LLKKAEEQMEEQEDEIKKLNEVAKSSFLNLHFRKIVAFI